MKYTRSDFPDSFLFGLSATDSEADAQTEGFDSFRFQVHWSKVMPTGRGRPDTAGLDHYERLTDALLTRGLRPCAVLNPNPLPPELDDLGGWRNRDTAARYADFADCVVARIGDRLFTAATSIVADTQPDSDERTRVRTMHHHLLAHGRAIRVMRGLGMGHLGVEIDLTQPGTTAILNESYPDDMRDSLNAHLSDGWEQDFATITEPVDWYGVRIRNNDGLECLSTLSDWKPAAPVHVIAEGRGADVIRCIERIQAATASLPIAGFTLQAENPAVSTLRSALVKTNLPTPWVPSLGKVHDHWNLIADVGGTNTRLGVFSNGELAELHRFPTGTTEDLSTALHTVRDAVGTDPEAVVAAGAGPLRYGTIYLTNAQVALSQDELSRATGAQRTFVINDFTAAAWSVADVTDADVAVLQGAGTPPTGTRLVVGPGTGLGVGELLYSEGHYHTLSGEGGHMGLSPRHRDEVDVFDAARRIAPECFFDGTLALEAEMFLSGTGLPILYQAVGMAEGRTDTPVRTARDILQAAQDGTDTCAVKTARMFTEHLGAIMGDLAVALIPAGGVFLVGGVAEKNRWLFGQDFLNAFNTGGRFDDLRRGMNLYVSEQEEFGIIGANNFCKNALAR